MSEVLGSENNDADPYHKHEHAKAETSEHSFHKILLPNILIGKSVAKNYHGYGDKSTIVRDASGKRTGSALKARGF